MCKCVYIKKGTLKVNKCTIQYNTLFIYTLINIFTSNKLANSNICMHIYCMNRVGHVLKIFREEGEGLCELLNCHERFSAIVDGVCLCVCMYICVSVCLCLFVCVYLFVILSLKNIFSDFFDFSKVQANK